MELSVYKLLRTSLLRACGWDIESHRLERWFSSCRFNHNRHGRVGNPLEMGIPNGKFRILKWRYGEDHIFGRMFCGDIPYIGLMYGTSNQSGPKSWPLIQMGKLRRGQGYIHEQHSSEQNSREPSSENTLLVAIVAYDLLFCPASNQLR